MSTTDISARDAAGPGPMARLLSPGLTLYLILFLAVAFFVIYPVVTLFVNSFRIGGLGQVTGTGLGNWAEAFQHRQLLDAIYNTLSLSISRQFVSFLLGVAIAWLIARTNLPGRGWIEVGFWIALFMPALPVTMSWLLLAGGRPGLINVWARDLGLTDGVLVDIYSYWGIVCVHLVTATLPVKVFLLAPAFRNMDASLEESARTCGSGLLGTLTRIVVPIMTPTIIVVMLLGLIRSMQAFEVELILGARAGIEVYSTIIYHAMTQEPPLEGVASVMSITFLLLIVPFVMLQQWYTGRHSYATVGGKFSARVQDLGPWKWPIFAVLVVMLLVMTVLPTIMLIVGSFMKLFGQFSLAEPWTTRHWVQALSRHDLAQSFANTMYLGLGSAIVGMGLFSILAYYVVKSGYIGRRTLDFFTWLPTVVPGIVISLAFLQMFTATGFLRPLYGTMWVLIIAVVLGSMTVGVQLVKGTLIQLNNELEEASWTSGASRVYTFRRIVLPLIAPSVIVVGLQVFATAVSVVGLVALLGTGQTQPLSILQLVYMDSGRFETATIVGLFVLIITILAALVARFVSARATLGNR